MSKFKVSGVSQIHIDNSAGTLLNVSAYVETLSALGKEIMPLEVTTFADSAERFISGIEVSQEITLSGPFDDTASVGIDSIAGTLVGVIASVQFAPIGTASGQRKYTGEFLWTKYSVNSAVKERVSYELVGKLDGTLSVGTF